MGGEAAQSAVLIAWSVPPQFSPNGTLPFVPPAVRGATETVGRAPRGAGDALR